MMVFDIPLLFETGAERRMDKVVVVHCDPETQRARLLARPGMDEATATLLLGRQMPQADKIARADFLVSTDHGIEAARDQVRKILAELRA
jgi:dephospho-CoA kinase